MATPQDGNRGLARSKYVPTPKMSNRKKSLFATESSDLVRNSEEDADLGSMSPLKFSNSPKRSPMKVLNITSFRNILGNMSPDSDRSLSPDFERRFAHSERYEILPPTYDKENEIMDEETRLSFSNGTPRMPSQTESALLDENNSNSLSKLMSSDLNIVDKKNPILRTPGLSNTAGQKKEPRTSFRKTSFPENTSTPNDERKSNSFFVVSGGCRARTSLSFSDIRPISTKSFYATNKSPEGQKPVPKLNQTHSTISYDRLPQKRAMSNPRKRQPTKKRNDSIRLGSFNRGVFHKIKKPAVKKPKETVKKLSTSQILESTASLFEHSPVFNKKSLQSRSAPSSPVKPEPMKRQIERIKKILTSYQNPIEQAKPLQLSKSMMALETNSWLNDENEHSKNSSSREEPGESDEEAIDNNDDQTKLAEGGRKFFKSSSNRRVKREYKVVNNVLATVRKGGHISLKAPKQKKRKLRSLFEEEFDFASEQLEVDDIISKLAGSQEESNPVCENQTISCTTAVVKPPISVEPEPPVQIEVIDAIVNEISNDEPISVQPNVIYVERLSPLLNGADSNSEESCCNSRENPLGEDGCMQTEYQESPTMQIRTMTSSLTITKGFNFSDQLKDTSKLKSSENQGLFPIFSKDHQRKLTVPIQDTCHTTLFDIIRRKPKRLRMARGVGSNQYQIDAGQKKYGAHKCQECGLLYSVHEPEEELIHENYHSSLHILRFTGWSSEVVVSHVPTWDVTGRVLVVGMTAGKHKLQKVQEVLAVVDRELGFVESCQMTIGSVVYLAVARSTILGICAVQPLQHANRLLTIEGTEGSIDCCTMETYPVKCGISRIWVSPSFRGHGIARTLLTVMKSHFIFGYQMSYDEIAFSAPTEAGKRLAEAVTGRKDFLIYTC